MYVSYNQIMQTPEQCIDPALDKDLEDGNQIIEKVCRYTTINQGSILAYIPMKDIPRKEVAAIGGNSERRLIEFIRANLKHGVVEELSLQVPGRNNRFTTRAVSKNGFLVLTALWSTFCMPGSLYENNPPRGGFTPETLNLNLLNTRVRLGQQHPFSAHIYDINPVSSEDSQAQTRRRIITIRLASEEPESTKKKEHKNLFDLKIDLFRELPEISNESAKQELETWDPKRVSEKNISLGKIFHQPDDKIQDPEISEFLRIAFMHILVFKAGNKEQLDHAIDVMFGRYEAVKLGFYHAVDIFNQCKDYPMSDRLNNLYDIYKAIRRSMERNLFRNPDPVPHFALRATRGRAAHTGRII